ncbi:MAG: hypothetical protein AAFV95_19700 [Bacteroidota bacterium]
MSIQKIEESFVRNFVRKERRERALSTLRSKKPQKRTYLLDKMNHSWTELLLEKYLQKIESKSDQDVMKEVKARLGLSNKDLCYIISYDQNDGKMLDFETAFAKCQSIGYAGLIIGPEGDRFYLKTEQVTGAPNKFIGLR